MGPLFFFFEGGNEGRKKNDPPPLLARSVCDGSAAGGSPGWVSSKVEATTVPLLCLARQILGLGLFSPPTQQGYRQASTLYTQGMALSEMPWRKGPLLQSGQRGPNGSDRPQ